VSPIHFGIIMAVNLSIGMYTPPVRPSTCSLRRAGVRTRRWARIYVGVLPFVLINFRHADESSPTCRRFSMVLLNLTR